MSQDLPDLRGLRVGVLGDGIVDHYIEAAPARLSREAPVMVLRHRCEELRPGGAANVARNVVALGARCALFGVVGDDLYGRALQEQLGAIGVDIQGVVAAAGHTTPTKTRVLAGEAHRMPQQVLRIDREPDAAPPPEALTRLAGILERASAGLDALIVSDYGYGGLGPATLDLAGRLAARGVPVVVDPRRRPDLVAGPTALTPNLDELAGFHGCTPEALADPGRLARAGRDVLARSGARWLLATLGNRGMALFGKAGEAWTVAAAGSDDVVDVSGAGDTAAATFALALAAGRDAPWAMALANAAAGLVVMERGTAVCDARALSAALVGAPQAIDARPELIRE
ncbi:bifunctional heptose 7-phosphate kinase/heptose 1-phosphate adenyltransferase [Engelhardtia mirabilis]|uniref:Bifunctional protein HldE n=1 Tax=Engelhardtia mirabilis TaxID=2528011 RepID=A0A518BPR1_9BACT|nr:Bifunctional protein HldE [Planctomycetes bacterium Pla133]QDV03250.1 Bifunctional protein HldE [Planctomycetes bacterium Pla86]